jgi:hypothetical protein
MKQKVFIGKKKKSKMAHSKKAKFFKTTNSQKIFAKISGICPWLSTQHKLM